MVEQHEWRVESFQDELDPFANIQWLVLQGNVVIAQCEVQAHAELLIETRARGLAYEQALQRISAMSRDTHDVDAAIDAAFRALDA